MNKELDTFNELYLITNEWISHKPWMKLWSNDWIKVSFSPEEEYYCTVMGKLGDCIGLSIYQGDKGFSDLAALSDSDYIETGSNFVMYDQNCLTFYLGDRQQLPPEQYKIIRELKLKYRGRGNWPFFLSMKKRFYATGINEQEAKIIIKVMKRLLETIEDHYHLINEDLLLHTYQQGDTWIVKNEELPDYTPKYQSIRITEPKLLKQLTARPAINRRLIIDLVYLNIPINENNFERPINALILLVLDADMQTIVYPYMLKPDDDEIEIILGFLIDFIIKDGIPQQLFIRNPIVLSTLEDTCQQCNIELTMTPLDMVDYIANDMKRMI